MLARRLIAVAVLVALSLAAFGCGKSSSSGARGSGSVPAGASIAPASAPVFVSIASDPSSDQWKAAQTLLNRFPGRGALLEKLRTSLREEELDFENDLKPALGPELDLVFLDFENGGNNVVGLTQPADKAKFEQALEKGSEPRVYRDFKGWLIFANNEEQLDRFEEGVSKGTLADQEGFSDLITHAPDDSLAKLYLAGAPVVRELTKSSTVSGLSLGDMVDVHGAVGWVRAEDDGLRVELDLDAKTPLSTEPFTPKLAEEFPAGALFYASLGHLDEALRAGLDSALKQNAGAKRRLEVGLTVLGLSLEGDIYPLFSGETAVGVYPGDTSADSFHVLAASAVDDEEGTKRLLSRLEASFLLNGQTSQKLMIAGTEFTQIDLQNKGISLLLGVADGKLIVSNSRALVEGLLGKGAKLVADPTYTSARSAADVPGESAGFFFANLEAGLPLVLDYAERGGGSIPPEVRANIEPLRSLTIFGSRDGEITKATGFVEIR